MWLYLGVAILYLAVKKPVDGQYHDGFTNSATFSTPAGIRARLFWSPGQIEGDYARFEIHAKTRGWMGVGFSPNGAMRGADIVVMWVDAKGTPQISDRHGPLDEANGFPPEDAKQDYEIVNGYANDTHTIFQFRRKMDTCDEFDWKITDETVRLQFAYNDNLPVGRVPSKHDEHFVISSRLIDPEDGETIRRILDDPKFTQYDFSTDGVFIPASVETLYYCRVIPLRKFAKPMQVIGFETFVDPAKILHHIIILGCRRNMTEYVSQPGECFDGTSSIIDFCDEILGGYAVGAQPYAFPDEMGVPYYGNEFDFVAIQIHYENVRRENVTDNSTIRFYLTDTLRPINIGALTLGTPVSPTAIVIPPQQKKFTQYAYCPSECTNRLGNVTLNVISGFLHSHTTAIEIRVRHIRNGVELPAMVQDNHYDFNYQSAMQFSSPRQLLPGDEFIVECVHSTMSRTQTTLGGQSTREEMCGAILAYYPLQDRIGSKCASRMNAGGVLNALGAKSAIGDLDNPKELVIVDEKGDNRTYLEWMKDLNWQSANNGTAVSKLQTYQKNEAHSVLCKIAMPTTETFQIRRNPEIIEPLKDTNKFCAKQKDGSGTSATTKINLLFVALAAVFPILLK